MLRIVSILAGIVLLTSACSMAADAPAKATAKNPIVMLKTSMGDIEVELFADKAPITVKNFLAYTNAKFYDNTIFHRVIPNFMVQCGGFTEKMVEKKANPPIKNEANNGLKNDRGTLAMARTNVVDSATCQFFINVVPNHYLNHVPNSPQRFGYAVFGKVVKGMDVVDKISKAATHTAIANGVPYANVPKTPIVIKTVRLKK